MAFSRYMTVPKTAPGKTSMSTASASIRFAVINDVLAVDTHILEEGQRLDQISAERYGDSSYWWVIAAASGIGWSLQLPPGTFIIIPRDIGSALSLII
tara:strand:- start:359 stop:652 length:294 start_codon:yes stop_codon:yes gene_type:complete